MRREVEVEERLCDIKDQLDTLMIEKEQETPSPELCKAKNEIAVL